MRHGYQSEEVICQEACQGQVQQRRHRRQGARVIQTIVETIGRDRGASMDELVEILSKKFPDGDPTGMRRTCGIQVGKHLKKKERDDKRGLVYYGNK